MSELGDIYKDWNVEKRIKKTENLIKSTQILVDRGVNFEKKNNGVMLIVTDDVGNKFVFYPSTGLFLDSKNKRRRGVKTLLALLGK